jgi:DNA-binding Lrp family transcriptional regulator
MDAIDRRIVTALQDGIAVSERPFAAPAAALGLDENALIARIDALLAEGVLSRFGPMYHAERLGGALTLAAMSVPEERFETVAETVNAFPEVAHNYARDHELNMWFVIATERPERIAEVIAGIEAQTGLRVYDMPKTNEYFVGLRFEA